MIRQDIRARALLARTGGDNGEPGRLRAAVQRAAVVGVHWAAAECEPRPARGAAAQVHQAGRVLSAAAEPTRVRRHRAGPQQRGRQSPHQHLGQAARQAAQALHRDGGGRRPQVPNFFTLILYIPVTRCIALEWEKRANNLVLFIILDIIIR